MSAVASSRPPSRTGQPVFTVRDLRVRFSTSRGPAQVVDGLDLDVASGEPVAVGGESGSGTSVSRLAALGLLPPSAHVTGSAVLSGQELVGAPADRLRRLRGPGVGLVFQDPMTSLNPVLSVRRQLVEGLAAHGRADVAVDRARRLLAEVGLPDPDAALRAYPHQLSGGMRQRVMIAIALAHDPARLVAAEATTALDVTVQAQILRLVARLQDEHGTGVVWITHDLGVVAGIADRVLVVYGGRCIETGPVEAIFDRPAHPYTRGLLASLPRLDDDDEGDLPAMTGLPPDPARMPPGCAFHPRCPVRDDARCATSRPPLRDLGGGHLVATWDKEGSR